MLRAQHLPALYKQQSACVVARYHELLNTSAQDTIANARERLRKGQ
jgi:hypothetical protein